MGKKEIMKHFDMETLEWQKYIEPLLKQRDSIFIKHIESHDEVKNSATNRGKAICKICGKTAEEIIKKAGK